MKGKLVGWLMSAAFVLVVVFIATKIPFTRKLIGIGAPTPAA